MQALPPLGCDAKKQLTMTTNIDGIRLLAWCVSTLLMTESFLWSLVLFRHAFHTDSPWIGWDRGRADCAAFFLGSGHSHFSSESFCLFIYFLLKANYSIRCVWWLVVRCCCCLSFFASLLCRLVKITLSKFDDHPSAWAWPHVIIDSRGARTTIWPRTLVFRLQ